MMQLRFTKVEGRHSAGLGTQSDGAGVQPKHSERGLLVWRGDRYAEIIGAEK